MKHCPFVPTVPFTNRTGTCRRIFLSFRVEICFSSTLQRCDRVVAKQRTHTASFSQFFASSKADTDPPATMFFKAILIAIVLIFVPVAAQREDNDALRDLEIGMAGLKEASKNPALLAQLMQDMQVRRASPCTYAHTNIHTDRQRQRRRSFDLLRGLVHTKATMILLYAGSSRAATTICSERNGWMDGWMDGRCRSCDVFASVYTTCQTRH